MRINENGRFRLENSREVKIEADIRGVRAKICHLDQRVSCSINSTREICEC